MLMVVMVVPVPIVSPIDGALTTFLLQQLYLPFYARGSLTHFPSLSLLLIVHICCALDLSVWCCVLRRWWCWWLHQQQ